MGPEQRSGTGVPGPVMELTSLADKDWSRGLQGSPRLLLVHTPCPELKEVAQLLRSFTRSVEIVPNLSSVPDGAQYDLSIINHDGLTPDERRRMLGQSPLRERGGRLALLSEKVCGEDLVSLLDAHLLTNLVGRGDGWLNADILVTVGKILRRDIFGIEKYFSWGVQPRSFQMTLSSQKGQLLEEAEVYARSIGVHPRLVDLFCTVADEFASNALFNAPVDGDGRRRFAHLERTNEVALDQSIEFKFLSDGRRLGISVADPFGSLTPERVAEYLARCLRMGSDQIDEKKGGAGLGLYCIFNSVSHFVVNISPGKKTEMIGLLDIRGSYRDFLKGSKSLNLFVEK